MSDMNKPNPPSPESVKSGYEITDTSPIKLIIGTLIIVGLIAFFVIAMNELFLHEADSQYRTAVLERAAPELAAIRAQDQKMLTSYQAVSADSGIYRIPVERAMELVANEAQSGRMNQAPAAADTTKK